MFGNKKLVMLTRPHNSAIIVAAVTIVCLIPFVNKAFHIDDPLFIWTAEQIHTNPADFYGFSVNWYGRDMPMAEVTKNPPAASYYIALVGLLFGWSEVALHTAFLIPAVAAALGTYYLARRFCSRPVTAALASVLTPVFLVSSTNLMCDTMMLAFWVWAVFLWVQAIEGDKHAGLFFASILIAACALTKYFGMSLLALLFVYSLMQKRKLGIWALYLLVPVVILAVYQRATHGLYGYGLLSDAAAFATEFRWTGGTKLFSKGLTGLLFTGGCIATALFYAPLLWSKRVLAGGAVLTILFMLILSSAESIGTLAIHNNSGDVKWSSLIQIGLMAAAGVCILGLAAADFRKYKNAESLLLLLWVLGTFIFAGFVNWTVNTRSIFPMIPAVGILLMRRIDHNNKSSQRIGTWRAAWPLIPAALIAFWVCWADYTWANTARTAATAIRERFANSRGTVWFQGHWGFQYYMEAAGGKALDFENSKTEKGDIIIVPSNNSEVKLLPEETVHLIGVLRFSAYRWLATVNMKLGAGFYSDMWGPLPFAAGPVEAERYYAFIVK